MISHRYVVDNPSTFEAFYQCAVNALWPPSPLVLTAHKEIDELAARRSETPVSETFRLWVRDLTSFDSPYWFVHAENADTGQWVAFAHNPETETITFEAHTP